MKTYFLGWTNIRKFIRELILTLTSKESIFSQKKVLIYLIDISMLITSLVFMYYHRATMTAGEHCMIISMWLLKGVSSVIMTQQDKKLNDNDKEQDNLEEKSSNPV